MPPVPSADSAAQDIIQRTQQLLDSVTGADWKTYQELCATDLTGFEPEANENLLEGMPFHKHFFDLADGSGTPDKVTTSLCSPHVRLIGDSAVIAYVRMTQRTTSDGNTSISSCKETRIWHQDENGWKHVHFHRG
ncbi:Calcium/calmodulin dependent protein kinase II Association [Roseimaritima multifibrata]|uniref:Calcium/calmodulin dependent protein kinase II Association n=1 Tax=Roseimaritima multifibrata TaxID=1930274 RepID=A0A517MAQ1_9BACT|nr:DUF4440 domain-containing protein [Roseimaritima multifibrata]QDS91959.1 Calcium/calmodulin dependent protein kinase II Association [Roseimaritima multifibrata]